MKKTIIYTIQVILLLALFTNTGYSQSLPLKTNEKQTISEKDELTRAPGGGIVIPLIDIINNLESFTSSGSGLTQTIGISSYCNWEIQVPLPSWIQEVKTMSGSANISYIVEIVAKENFTVSSNQGSLQVNALKGSSTISTENITITQEAMPEPILIVTPSLIDFESSGSGLTKTIGISSNCDWEIQEPLPSWIQEVSRMSGNANISYMVEIVAKENTTVNSNEGSLQVNALKGLVTVLTKNITINQEAGPIPFLDITPSVIDFESSGSGLTRTVGISSNLNWKIKEPLPSWIQEVSRMSGNANISYMVEIVAKENTTVDANEGALLVKAEDGLFTLIADIQITQEARPESEFRYYYLARSENKNYIHTITPLIPLTEVLVDNEERDAFMYNETIAYYDGLGRREQQIAIAASPNGDDIIQPFAYDELGRQRFNYLPYINTAGGQYDAAAIIEDPNSLSYETSNQYQYYFNNTPFGEDRKEPYSETVFDGSPLNRVMKQGAPGVDWQPNQDLTVTTDHVARFEYSTNSATDNISLVKVTSSGGLERSGYQDGTLFISISYDENGNVSKEYKNLQGQVVAKKSHDGTDWLTTYYVYDDFGLLRHVLTPEFIDQFAANYGTASTVSKNDAILKEWCYYYEYDGKKRMILKRLPGAEPVFMVYDNRDRLVLTQDGEQRKDIDWAFIQYDELNRPVTTGIVEIRSSEEDVRNYFNDYAESNATRSATEPGYTIHFPMGTGSIDHILTVTFYDNYTYPGVIGFNADENIGLCNGSTTTYETEVKGFITGTKTRVGSENNWTVETPYYDEYGRVIYSKRTVDFGDDADGNNVAGSEIISNKYKFSGELVQTKQIQTLHDKTTEVNNYMSYDHMGRLLNTQMDANGFREVIADLKYNELGQLVTKEIGNGLQELNYSYNIRGWLTKINDMDDIGDDLYCQNLAYNNPIEGVSNEKQYNGNISAITWIDGSYPYWKSYKYSYDALNRLIQADYNDSPSTADNTHGVHGIKYDLNGNIKELKRNGYNKSVGPYGAFGVIDDLVYNYSGNKLIGVRNEIFRSESSIFKDGLEWDSSYASDKDTWEYKYDANGNMTEDKNKNLVIFYNHLNLPKLIFIPGGTVNYLYDAAGTKYKKTTRDGFGTRYYFSNFEYDNNMKLEFIHTSEGRVRVNNNAFAYDYYLKDHLGNTRVVFTNDGNNIATKLQVSNYYPFGARFSKTNMYSIADKTTDYMYNGKEFQEETEWYDYGARMYDPALGRWHCMDPLAEDYYDLSPYNYVANNPLRYIDPNGMNIDDYFNKDGEYLGKDNAETDNVKVIDQADWDANKTVSEDGSEAIDHETGEANSENFTESDISTDATLEVYDHYNPTDLNVVAHDSENGKGGMSFAYSKNKQVLKIKIEGNKTTGTANDANNIKNMFAHENKHYSDFKKYGFEGYRLLPKGLKESWAVYTQKQDPSWKGTTTKFKKSANKYGRKYSGDAMFK